MVSNAELNPTNICRLCLESDGYLVGIFSELFAEPLNNKIRLLFAVSIAQNDGLPQLLCHKCLVLTENCMEFRESCQKNEERLRQLFNVELILEDPVENLINPVSNPVLNQVNGTLESEDEPEHDIIMLDPNKIYESSDEEEECPPPIAEAPIQQIATPVHSNPPITQLPFVVRAKSSQRIIKKKVLDGQEESPMKSAIFLCKYCDIAFPDSETCNNHETNEHDLKSPYSCNFCEYRSDSKNTIIYHIREIHRQDRPFICVQCMKGFVRRSDLKKHTFVHSGIRPFACKECHKTFSRNTNLTKHKRIHSGVKPFSCEFCPRTFSNKSDLLRHHEIHIDSRSFACKVCNQAFQRRDKLAKHEKTHTNQNVIQQQHMYQIQQHVNAQSHLSMAPAANFYTENMVFDVNPYTNGINGQGPNQFDARYSNNEKVAPVANSIIGKLLQAPPMNKNFICSICNKGFSRKRELDRHSLIHMPQLKPFQCTSCDKSFGRKDKLLRHERTHFNENKWSCMVCNAQFSRADLLTAHAKLHQLNGDQLATHENAMNMSRSIKNDAIENYLEQQRLRLDQEKLQKIQDEQDMDDDDEDQLRIVENDYEMPEVMNGPSNVDSKPVIVNSSPEITNYPLEMSENPAKVMSYYQPEEAINNSSEVPQNKTIPENELTDETSNEITHILSKNSPVYVNKPELAPEVINESKIVETPTTQDSMLMIPEVHENGPILETKLKDDSMEVLAKLIPIPQVTAHSECLHKNDILEPLDLSSDAPLSQDSTNACEPEHMDAPLDLQIKPLEQTIHVPLNSEVDLISAHLFK